MIAYFTLGLTTSQYWTNAYQALEYNDIVQGLLKPFVFAFIISLVGCFYGLRTTGGTQGVGLRHHQGRGGRLGLDLRAHLIAHAHLREFELKCSSQH